MLKDFRGTGVPAEFEFEISASAGYFTLEMPGHMVHQTLTGAISPAAEVADEEVVLTEAPAPVAAGPVPAARPALAEPVAPLDEEGPVLTAIVAEAEPVREEPRKGAVNLDLSDLAGDFDFELELRSEPKR